MKFLSYVFLMCCLFGSVSHGQEGPTIIIGTPKPLVDEPWPVAPPFFCGLVDRQISATITLLQSKRERLRELGAQLVLTPEESEEFDVLFRLVDTLSMALQLLQTIYCDCGCE